MASVLVYISGQGESPSPAGLGALGAGRRVSSLLGATLYAAVPTARRREECEEWIVALGRGGADKVLLMNGEELGGPTQWSTHGPIAVAACRHVDPRLVLFASDVDGRGLAPRVAASLDARFLAHPDIEWRDDLPVFVRRDSTGTRRLEPTASDRPLVVALAGQPNAAEGDDEAEVIFFDSPEAPPPEEEFELIDSDDGGNGDLLERAPIVVTAGAGIHSHKQLSLVQELAAALGAELAGTASACRRGLAPADREVSVVGHHVSPQLYVVCGASGSDFHLGAVAGQAEIVAVNSDPDAPIFSVASCGIVGEIEEVLPGIIAAVKERGEGALR